MTRHSAYSPAVASVNLSDDGAPPVNLAAVRKVRSIVDDTDAALQNDDIDAFLRAYAELGISAPRKQIINFGERALANGKLYDGLFAFALIGASPDPYYLELCADQHHDDTIGRRATYLARLTPQREASDHRGLAGVISAILHK